MDVIFSVAIKIHSMAGNWCGNFMYTLVYSFIYKDFLKLIFHTSDLNFNNLLEVCLVSALNLKLIINFKLNVSL